MSESIQDLLANKNFDEPSEIKTIKEFVSKNYDQTAKVSINQTSIIINVPSASLAGALRLRLHELQRLCDTDKKLVIRIG